MTSFGPLVYSPDRSIEVLNASKRYFDKNEASAEQIADLGWCYQSVAKSIPQTTENMWSGHFFPYLESNDELQISFNLALFGLYKQAFVSLRNALEVGLLSVYYNINDDGHLVVKNWFNSRPTSDANTPRTNQIWKILRANPNINNFDEKFGLRTRFDDLAFLHNYVHTKGHKFSNQLGRIKSNCQTFEEDILLKWIAAYENVVILLITLHMLKYPIASVEFDWSAKAGIDNPFPVLEKFEIERIGEILPDGFLDEIQSIASKDSETQNLLNHIISVPDLTAGEREAQQIAIDKILIEHGPGFIEWEMQQRQLWTVYEFSDEEKDKALFRLDILRKWAIDNDMMHPILDRR